MRGARVVFASVLHQALLVITLPVWGLLALLTLPLPYRLRYRLITSWGHLQLWTLERLCRVRVRVEGLAHRPEQPCVVMAKHQSAWETLGLLRWFQPQTWVLKRELMRIPVFGWGLALLQPIAIDRGSGALARRQVVEQGRERLRAGRWVIIFPEGTRVPAGRKGRYRAGGAILACETGTPILPVAHNAGEIWPRGSIIKQPGEIRVRIGPAIATEGRQVGEVLAEVEAWIEAQMPEISERGYPGTLYTRSFRK
ncbi:lysophospholipid acyltransferase family protein [Alkalilimnicola ehrlichii MLHE-1]|uniref:Phospholipid/glycerol acyltransferase n=1 Tax=Alkalilimnicola ehrlichii (strain ATCC BAA-1101 / DSM 17681 / MLHE-1) TaxID=187272 RepID=Q0ACR9_ALKEH|nr:lysophospholipid acyltransferase family protein [Alkalilimnicola ehrlichii]ABI55368.1 phospholipid/glycerol acyltransferase [Alkalilimnicola ehrlichii MLHE-1]